MAALIGITAGFGALIGAETLAQLKARGFAVVRQGDQRAGPLRLRELIDEIVQAGLRPLVNCTTAQLAEMPEGTDVEVIDKPDPTKTGMEPLFLTGPAAYAAALNAVADVVRARKLRAWAGLTGTAPSDLKKLATVLQTLDPVYGISVHRYPPGGATTWTASFVGSRYLELTQLRAVIGTRPFIVGECGWQQGPYKRWYNYLFGGHQHLDDAQQAALLEAECRYWVEAGAELTCIYQLNDGPERCSTHPWMPALTLGGYGIRRQPGGVWKSSSGVPLKL